jgi:glycosyltransferase involved in cell wall biosynthesis
MDISIVIPIYYNQGSISITCDKIVELFKESFKDLMYEIILVDDGSKDKSYEEMIELKNKFNTVRVIKFTRNFGQVPAIYAGYKTAKGIGILNIAADLQEPIDLVYDMVHSFLNKDAKIIAGQRIGRDESNYRKYTSLFFYNLMKKLSFKEMPIGGFDIVLIHKDVRDVLLNLNESNPFWQGQLLWTGYPIKFIPYTRLKREIGSSKWSFSKKIKYLLDGVLSYSYAPLRFFSFIGIITFILGVFYSIYIVISFFLGATPFKGWAPIMIVILLFSGLQLVMLGLIGEYVWRNLEQSKKRPFYIIED